MSCVIDAGYSGAVERNGAERIHVAAAHKVIEEQFNNKRDQWVYSQTVSRWNEHISAAAGELLVGSTCAFVLTLCCVCAVLRCGVLSSGIVRTVP